MPGSPAEADLAAVAGAFGDLVHRAGVPVTPERSGRFAAALVLAVPGTVDELYWLARVTLIADVGDVDLFDRVFAQVFRGLVDVADFRGNAPAPAAVQRGRPRADRGDSEHRRPTTAPMVAEGGAPAASEGVETGESVLAAMSSEERLRTTEFASMTEDELAALHALMARLAIAPPARRSRRTQRRRRGSTVDLRASLRRAMRTGGDPIELQRRRHRTRPRRLVVLCDISGSMEPYARAYLQLLHSAVGGARAEAFVFATRLTRVTKALHRTNPDRALQRAGQTAPDWAGGTLIGGAIAAFNDRHGRRGMARGAIVVIVSDGWEGDDVALLEREMQRLGRLAHRVIWVNPRKAAPGFLPTTAGMVAALPYVDDFVSGHTLTALDDLLTAISRIGV